MRCEPLDPAAVAALEKTYKQRTRLLAVGGGTAFVVVFLVTGWNWVRDTRVVMTRTTRPKEPWEQATQEFG